MKRKLSKEESYQGGSLMEWGIFETETQVHVAPCDDKRVMYQPHQLTLTCSCTPEVKKGKVRDVLIHKLVRNPVDM